jgi:hypothetical protein
MYYEKHILQERSKDILLVEPRWVGENIQL